MYSGRMRAFEIETRDLGTGVPRLYRVRRMLQGRKRNDPLFGHIEESEEKSIFVSIVTVVVQTRKTSVDEAGQRKYSLWSITSIIICM